MREYYFDGQVFDSYDFLAIDVTNGCNLRCVFCFNDWQEVGANHFMTPEIFLKVMDLLPLIKSGPNCYLSCLYEPLIHPQFDELLHLIPQEKRKQFFFTTNLAANLKDKLIEQIANSGIEHVNVSLDSLHPATYEAFRKGASFDRFYENLKQLVNNFAKSQTAPRLCFYTMVSRMNLKEIPVLLKKAHQDFHCSEIEIRPLWQVPCNAKWLADQYINESEYQQLKKELDGVSLSYQLGPLKPQQAFMKLKNLTVALPNEQAMRISASGRVDLLKRDVHFNLDDISNPQSFFRDLLKFISLDTARAKRLREYIDHQQKETAGFRTRLKKIISFVKRI